MITNLFTSANPAPSRGLVVLLHGFLGSRVQLLPLAATISRNNYSVLNYSYRSRSFCLNSHSLSLVDTLHSRLERTPETPVHFVTHSFGGVVLHRAFSDGLKDVVGNDSRVVMIAPPVRGAKFARAFRQDEGWWGKGYMAWGMEQAARGVLGGESGKELMEGDAEWFRKNIGHIPHEVDVLVIVGEGETWWNPLIGGKSDGVVGVDETVLRRKHWRLGVRARHNMLLYKREVESAVLGFIGGNEVGELMTGPEVNA